MMQIIRFCLPCIILLFLINFIFTIEKVKPIKQDTTRQTKKVSPKDVNKRDIPIQNKPVNTSSPNQTKNGLKPQNLPDPDIINDIDKNNLPSDKSIYKSIKKATLIRPEKENQLNFRALLHIGLNNSSINNNFDGDSLPFGGIGIGILIPKTNLLFVDFNMLYFNNRYNNSSSTLRIKNEYVAFELFPYKLYSLEKLPRWRFGFGLGLGVFYCLSAVFDYTPSNTTYTLNNNFSNLSYYAISGIINEYVLSSSSIIGLNILFYVPLKDNLKTVDNAYIYSKPSKESHFTLMLTYKLLFGI